MDNFEVIDDNLIAKLSLRSGSGFLTLIDAEINAQAEPNSTFQEEKHTIKNHCNKLAEENKTDEERRNSFEYYKIEHPDSIRPYGDWYFDQNK